MTSRPPADSDCDVSLLDLAALLDGQLSQPGRRRLAAHVARCAGCRATQQALFDRAAADVGPDRDELKD